MASSTLHSAGIARYTIWAARLVVFAAFFDLFVQFPTIAPYAESLGASAALVGVIVAAYSFTNLFGNLGAGYVLDRWGRERPCFSAWRSRSSPSSATRSSRRPSR